MRSSRIAASLFATVALFLAFFAAAQDRYPERPVRFIVPYTAGGSADTLARVVGQKLGETWGQSFIVDNRTGGGGNIGTELVARASPDGYTLLLGFIGNLAIGPSYYAKLPFDPVRDFAPVTELAGVHNLLVVHPSLPARTLGEFVAYVKANPGKINFSSASIASPGHLAGELLNVTAGIRMVHVPYKGGSQALTDLLGGQIHAMFSGTSVLPHVRSGKLRALATCGAQRTAVMPELPTIAESGFPGFEATGWFGVLAPARTPRPVVVRLHREITSTLRVPEVRERLERGGFDLVGNTPEEFGVYIRSEISKWAKVVRIAGVKQE
jgi:tripartite-type tricarboxylate transporter receptor subunit TctC